MPDSRTHVVSRSQAIRTRLVLAFLFITILPLVVVGIISVTGTLAQRDQIYSQLGLVTHAKRAEIRFWVESLQTALRQMVTGENETAWMSDVIKESKQARFTPVYAMLLDTLKERVQLSQLDSIFIADSTGQVIFSTDPALLDQNVRSEPFFTGGQTGPLVSASTFTGAQGAPVVTLAQPFKDQGGRTLGVVVGRATLSKILPIMQDVTGLGENGDAYLVDKNHIALLPSRSIEAGLDVYNAATGAALTNYNEPANNVYVNPSGASVLGVSEWVPELQAALVAERSLSEVTQTSNAAQAVNLSIAISAVSIALYASFLMSRSIGQPLSDMADTVSQIAEGNLNLTAEVEREDEVAVVAQAINSMTAQLRDMIGSLETRVELRTAQVQAGADVSRAVTSILDTEQLLNAIVNVVTERFGFYYTAIFTLDHTRTFLVLREATGKTGRLLKERGHRLRVGLDSMVGYAVLKHEPRVALNAGEDAVRFANPLLPDTQSEIALPLLVGDQVLGALDVQSTDLNAFEETAIATLQNVAAQISIALQNAESYKQMQQTLAHTTRQYELSRTIFTADAPSAAYKSLGHVFAMLHGVDRVSLWRVVDRDSLGQPAEYELAAEWDALGGARLDTGQRSSTADTLLAGLAAYDETIIIRDVQNSQLPHSTREQLAQASTQAVVLTPLTVQGRFDGFLAIIAEQPYDFQDSEVRLVVSAAEQLGVVLSNLQLTGEMQATLDRVALLNRRLSGEAWSSYLVDRDQLIVESGDPQQAIGASRLQVPIVVRGETIGAFDVADTGTDRQWQAEELTMLQTIAGEVALAIENTRLIEQTQRTAQREKEIAVAADKIHSSIDLTAILHTAVEEVMRLAGTADVAIQLGQPAANRNADTISLGQPTRRKKA